ncbi:HNH endonuclease signature motif containing protein [Georgenia subflava]|uniref:DUF222 domain-containing protein n=1 Tax=Georgenia subflava TaxID=1622177 RepID=A0A6N7EET6_9MICO|nr:HNH endonuclease signature motif containing protein [Georgenia subflava]MPV36619.1 DUF222 domain-containing protein [Georgenia subflava]
MSTTSTPPPSPGAGSCGPGSPGLTARLEAVRADLATLDGLDLQGLASQELLDAVAQVETLTRQVESLTARVLTAAEADGMWATSGARSFAAWYRNTTGRKHTSAARAVRQARLLRDQLPATAAALKAGSISADHVAVMTRHTTDTPDRRAQLTDPHLGEDFLITQAKTMDASDFDKVVRHWAIRTDPEAADRHWIAESDREELTLAPTTGGYHLQGWLSTVNGQALQEALDARIGTPAADDNRSTKQRRAGALVSLTHLSLDSGALKPGARIRPHIGVNVTYDTFRRLIAANRPDQRGSTEAGTSTGARTGAGSGCTTDTDGHRPVIAPADRATSDASASRDTKSTDSTDRSGAMVISTDLDYDLLVGADPATLSDGTPIPHQLLARLACQSQLHRTIFGPDSQILDHGREERLFTPAQTRAIIARDRRCKYPGCDAPPGEGEIHHSLFWYDQYGPTNAAFGILLCWHHHEYVHQHNITIERTGDHWTFTRRDGTTITLPYAD